MKIQSDGGGRAMQALIGVTLGCLVALTSTETEAQSSLYFIHADHLNTPRLVANAAGTTVWKWDQQEPFGDNVADDNPSGLGSFDLPLRLPGQRYDQETGLYYNYYRDYDPDIGGYAESDPLGIVGGMNTYLYAKGNPLARFDTSGLFTEVIAWDPVITGTSQSAFGHLSVNINGENFSFGPGGWDTRFPLSENYAARQQEFRAGRGVTLPLTPQQEAQLITCLKEKRKPYSTLNNNCTTGVTACLTGFGFNINAFYPDQIVRYLRRTGQANGTTFYPGPYSPRIDIWQLPGNNPSGY